MNSTNSTSRSAQTVSRVKFIVLSVRGPGVLMAFCLLMAHSALADTAEITWTGATSTGWSTLGNWTSGTTTSLVSAVFNATTTPYANQPALTVAANTAGIWDTDATTLTGVTTTISGAFGLSVSGTATLDGILTGSAGILLDGAANTTNSLDIVTNTLAISNSTYFTVNNGGTLTISGVALSVNTRTLTLGSTASSGSGSIVISSAITGGSAGSPDQININDTAGSTSVTLSGNSTFTGTTTLTAGTLYISSTGALGSSSDSFIINGGILDNNSGTSVTTSNVFLVLGGDFTYVGSNALNLGSTRTATLTSDRTITVESNTLTIQQIMVDSGSGYSLTKAGAGTLVLSGGTYSGGLNVDSGTVLATTGSAAGTGTITLGTSSGSSAAFVISGAASFTTANNISLASGDTAGTLTIGNTITAATGSGISGAIALNGDNLTLFDDAAHTWAFTGSIGGTGNINSDIVIGTTGITLSGIINNTGTITNNGVGTGGTLTISGTLGSNVQSIVQNSLTSLVVLSGSNPTFGGSLAVQSGTMEVTGSDNYSGTGTIILGSAGSATAAFLDLSTGTVSNALITTGSGATGTLLLGANSTSTTFYLGAVALTPGDTLTLEAVNAAVNFTGGFTGTGNLIATTNATGGVDISATAVNNNGTITNSGTGSGSLLITSGVGSGVTALTESSSTSALTVSSTLGTNALAVNGNGTTLTNNNSSGSVKLTVSGTGGVGGTGNLILDNNSAIANGITVSTSINNSGTLINSGGGAGSILISGSIGGNVQGVAQNSAGSSMTLSASNTYTGSTTITAGTLLLSAAGSITKSATIDVGAGATFDITGITSGIYVIGTTQTLAGGGSVSATGKQLSVAGTLNPGLGTMTGQTLGVTGTMALLSTASTALTAYAGGTNDQVTASSLLTYGGLLTITLSGLLTGGSYNYTLFSGGSTAGDFSSVNVGGVSLMETGANTWTGNVTNNGTVFAATFTDPDSASSALATLGLVASAVPEPSTWALVGISFCFLLGARYLRRRRVAG